MREMDIHKHRFNAVTRGDDTFDPLRGKCNCGTYSESNPYNGKVHLVSEEYVANLMGMFK